uniref:Protein phosphatase 1, regulatory subunit 12B n=1 Tax=Cyprinus carpio carpio TaxID=630221 RepID=A0A9J8DG05_CYPCA
KVAQDAVKLSTGVTLSELLEAKRAFSPSNRRVPEDTTETSPALREEQLSDKHPCEHLDKQGNWKRRPRSKPERSSFSLSSSVKGACGFTPSLRSRSTCIESECTDENDNILHGSSDASLTQQLTEDRDLSAELTQQDRASRSDSSGVESPSDRLSARTSTYTRRENRLASLSKTEDDSASKDYKKLYEDALTENEKLKSRLQDSKQELTKIRSQLDRVTQKQDRISERSSVFESEKREKEALEKRVSDMEEELKVLTELKSDNQRLKDENGALIRVISKLSK